LCMNLSPEVVQVLEDLNTWWADATVVRPDPPKYRRPLIVDLLGRLKKPKGVIEVIRGPRQVGKTTGIHQIIQDMLRGGTSPNTILFVRFDLELLRGSAAGIRNVLRWYVESIRKRALDDGPPTYLFLDEIHKLPRWHEEVKHVGDTYPVRMLLTGSSSVLVARGGRESLAGRVFTTELPTFSFREVLECWKPELAAALPPRIRFNDVFDGALINSAAELARLRPQQKLAVRRALERYYNRGGYPRLHSGEVEQDLWADYIVQTVFENVLGADIPDLFPVESPQLLRQLYLAVARLTGQTVSQIKLAEQLTVSGMPTNQPTVGRYLHYLADALLIREFRRYPIAKKKSARVPAKTTVSDLGVRNAIFRGAPSLWESDPTLLGPLVETLIQTVIRDNNLGVHYYRDYQEPHNRRSTVLEVDFVAERVDGVVLPVESKFRKKIDQEDATPITHFMDTFDAPFGVIVTREMYWHDEMQRLLFIPLPDFLLAF
jgi:predicted AAA+ superfamily ATPase